MAARLPECRECGAVKAAPQPQAPLLRDFGGFCDQMHKNIWFVTVYRFRNAVCQKGADNFPSAC